VTDQEKKSLRSFLKEMEREYYLASIDHKNAPCGAMALYHTGAEKMVERLLESYKAQFSEDLYPTCEVCNLPVSDEDSAGPGSNLHMSCVKPPCDHADDCPLDYCEPLCPDRAKVGK